MLSPGDLFFGPYLFITPLAVLTELTGQLTQKFLKDAILDKNLRQSY